MVTLQIIEELVAEGLAEHKEVCETVAPPFSYKKDLSSVPPDRSISKPVPDLSGVGDGFL